MFGRHANKRPTGLEVTDGGMWVDELMVSWGMDNNLEEADVLRAVQKNMLHGDNQRRFSLEYDNDSGRTFLRVHPKREKWNRGYGAERNRGYGTPPQGGGYSSRSTWASKHRHQKAPQMRGTVGRKDSASKLQTCQKLDMSLDEVVKKERDEDIMDDQAMRPHFDVKGKARMRRSVEQMSFTPRSADIRQPARRRDAGNYRSTTQGGRQGRARCDSSVGYGHNHDDVSRSPTPDEDDVLARAAGRLRVSDDCKHRRSGPPPPPGDHWTKFDDEGNIWWYYHGPLGKYWAEDSLKHDVQPYDDDED